MTGSDSPVSGRRGSSQMAEVIAILRMAEMRRPEDERLFSDPLAVHFVDPARLAWMQNRPEEARAFKEAQERSAPGWSNAIRVRIRFFDDVVGRAAADGVGQIVILGAGYDTRAYRIDAITDRIRVVEVDHPGTIEKMEILARVLGTVPDHVTFVRLDLASDNLWAELDAAGYARSISTLFVLEGLAMYLPRASVENLLSGIARNAAGSSVVLDCVPRFLADGTSDREGAKTIRDSTIAIGEPILSGFAEGEVERVLAGLGFSGVTAVPASEYRDRYFGGTSATRPVSSLLTFVRAEIG